MMMLANIVLMSGIVPSAIFILILIIPILLKRKLKLRGSNMLSLTTNKGMTLCLELKQSGQTASPLLSCPLLPCPLLPCGVFNKLLSP